MCNTVIFHKEIHENGDWMNFFKRKNAEIRDPRIADENIIHKQSRSLGIKIKPKAHIERWCTVTMLIITAIACIIIINV